MAELSKIMIETERKYPQLIDCLGTLSYLKKDCRRCDFGTACSDIRQDLNLEDFKPGKYRRGFGKSRRDRKTEPPE